MIIFVLYMLELLDDQYHKGRLPEWLGLWACNTMEKWAFDDQDHPYEVR